MTSSGSDTDMYEPNTSNMESNDDSISSAVDDDESDMCDDSLDMNFEKKKLTTNVDKNSVCGATHMSGTLNIDVTRSDDIGDLFSVRKDIGNKTVVDGRTHMESQRVLGVQQPDIRSSSLVTSSDVTTRIEPSDEINVCGGLDLGSGKGCAFRTKCDNEIIAGAIHGGSTILGDQEYVVQCQLNSQNENNTGLNAKRIVYTTNKLGNDIMYMCFNSNHDDKPDHQVTETTEVSPSDDKLLQNIDENKSELGEISIASNCRSEMDALPKHGSEKNIFRRLIQDIGIIENDKKSIRLNKKTPKRKQSYTNAVRKHVCEECGAAFTRKYYLEKHYLVHTGERPFTCTICKSSFGLKGTLRRHLMIHSSEKTFICDICNKSFTYLHILKRHKLVHTGEKPFSCEMCGAEFREKCHLDRHIFRHTGEKPFHCEICGMRFIEKYQKSRHMIQHSGKKPFKCETCGSEFARKTGLQNHTLSHTGERPFKCELCDMTYRRKDDLAKHQYKHTGVKPYFCGICNSSFTRKRHLEIHMHTQHGCTSERPIKGWPKKPRSNKLDRTSTKKQNTIVSTTLLSAIAKLDGEAKETNTK